MASKHEKQVAACEGRKQDTNGACEEEDCYGLGWCGYVLQQTETKKTRDARLAWESRLAGVQKPVTD